jgi:hypothetical protein
LDDDETTPEESAELDMAQLTRFMGILFPSGAGTYMVTIIPRDEEEDEPFAIHTVRVLDEHGRASAPGVSVIHPEQQAKASLN